MGLFKNIFGPNAYSNRELKRIEPIKNKVLELEEEYGELSDAELKAKTAEFKERLEDGETLDDILPEALATVREAAWRVLEKKPYPVQIIGAIVLHQGRIAEMKTGEGKLSLPALLHTSTHFQVSAFTSLPLTITLQRLRLRKWARCSAGWDSP